MTNTDRTKNLIYRILLSLSSVVIAFGVLLFSSYIFQRHLEKPYRIAFDYFVKLHLKDEETRTRYRFLGNLGPNPAKWSALLPPDSLLGWRMGKNIIAYHYGGAYVTTRQGFVSIGDPNVIYTVEKSTHVFRVIVLGGSTVMGQGATFSNQNLVACVDRVIKKENPSLTFETINAGVGGYFSGQEFLYLAGEIVNYHPDLVIVYDGWNDQSYINILLSKNGPAWNRLKSSGHYQIDSWLAESCSLKGNVSHLAAIAMGSFDIFGRTTKGGSEETFLYFPESVALYKNNLKQMILQSELNNFRIALFLQPLKGVACEQLDANERSLIKDYSVRVSFYKEARKMFAQLKREKGVQGRVCIEDLSQELRDYPTVYADSGHLNPKGNEIIADKIGRGLKKWGLLSLPKATK